MATATTLLAAAAGCGPRPVSPGPAIRFEATTVDAGTVPAGGKTQVRFKVRNAGGAPLHITRADGDCGCLTTNFPHELKPGTSGEILATYEPLVRADGKLERRIHVESDDPRQPKVDLTVSSNVIPFLKIEPAMIAQLVSRGKTYTKEILLTPRVGSKLKVLGAVSTSPQVSAKLLPPDPRDPQRTYRLKVTMGPYSGLGDWSSKVTLKTTEPKLPVTEVGVAALALDDVVVSPKEVSVPTIPADPTGEKELRRIQVFRRNGHVKVLKVETGIPLLAGKIQPTTPNQFYEISLRRTGKWKSGRAASVIRITTDDTAHPVLTVPFDATVQ